MLTEADAASLQRKLNLWRWLLWPLFPRGFAFEAGNTALVYDPRRGRVRLEPAGDYGDFVVSVPTLTLKEALAHDHLSDLGITMFVRIRLLRPLDPRKVYGLFVLFQFDDQTTEADLGEAVVAIVELTPSCSLRGSINIGTKSHA